MKWFKLAKFLLLTLPILIWVIYTGSRIFLFKSICRELKIADGITIVDEHGTTVLRGVEQRATGDIVYFQLQADHGSQTIYRKNVGIDWDMFGGGFVYAMQVDQDPEQEIVVWGNVYEETYPPGATPVARLCSVDDETEAPGKNHFFDKKSWYLDYTTATVVERCFDDASEHAQKIAHDWFSHRVNASNIVFFSFILMVCYYFILLVFLAIGKRIYQLFRRS
jgi:hypothetical protein